MKTEPGYIPALRFRFLTPFYDFVLRWLMNEQRFKAALVQAAGIQPEQHVLDLGCGTATLTLMIKQQHPQAIVTGVDGDTQVLSIARAKARRAGVSINLDEGMAYDLPYLDNTFDRVVSSLMFHHLSSEDKQRTFAEVHRILKSGGMVYVVDYGPPIGLWSRLVSPIMARFEQAGDNHRGMIPVMLRQAKFQEVVDTQALSTVFGTLNLFNGRKA